MATAQKKAPDKPIVINMNIKIDHEIRTDPLIILFSRATTRKRRLREILSSIDTRLINFAIKNAIRCAKKEVEHNVLKKIKEEMAKND